MRDFLSYEGRFTQVLLKVCNCCCLNALWLICSIPIFTMGAATTALYSVSFKLVRGVDGAVYRQFFRSFKENFKQATQLWLILLSVGIFLGVDGYILSHLRKATTGAPAIIWTLLFAVIIAAGIVYAILVTYTFPLLSYFDNTNRAMLLNSLQVGVRYLGCTLVVFGIHFLIAYVTINLFTPLAIFGMGLCAMLSAYMMSSVFYAISGEKRPSDDEEEDEEADEYEDS